MRLLATTSLFSGRGDEWKWVEDPSCVSSASLHTRPCIMMLWDLMK